MKQFLKDVLLIYAVFCAVVFTFDGVIRRVVIEVGLRDWGM